MSYDILYHNELSIKSVEKSFSKTIKQLEKGDFKSADVRKMVNTGYYRARLDLRDRLLFSVVQHGGRKYLLLLEVIKNHNYAGSRFLRGTMLPDDEQLLPLVDAPEALNGNVPEITYLNPANNAVHVLNKFISFDDLQTSVLSHPLPLIVIGAAGSGKTALVLEKLKTLPGSVAYISLSKFLVENASRLYYAHGFDNEQQEVEFLSLNEYLASWEKPEGKEIHFRAFERWFTNHAQALKINEPYRVYEEFKGVITGSPVDKAFLTKDDYLALGIKQSIFGPDERMKLYDLFQKYLQWLKENNWYDSNIVCYDYLQKVQPRYDYIMVDEVQDITNIQLKCILQSLAGKTGFVLTGDSNQIVHPNFFSWSKVKTYFHASGDAGKHISILQTNYRNSAQVVHLSNSLLKIKNTRFGSIDRESNYLISTTSKASGEVLLYTDEEKNKKELNRRTQESKDFAVIVADNIYKEEAKKYFKTPLIFSIQEAKGLEYENVVLVNFVSEHSDEFREIINGVSAADLEQEELRYNRASNKHDKDGEIYKFYINSFYVAITRAVKNIYLFEKQVNHTIFQLLQLNETEKEIKVAETKSSREEWLDEARRLEEQGKYEQAEQIRAKYLGYEYISPEQLAQILELALDASKKEHEVKRERKQLFQYALNHQRFDWIEQLASLQFPRAVLYMKELKAHRKEFEKNIRLGRAKEALSTINKYGIEFAAEEGVTGLMLALHHGQDVLVGDLLRMNASIRRQDKKGGLPIHHLLHGFYKNVLLKHNQMATAKTLRQFWHIAKPPAITMQLDNRQFQINGNSMLFYLLIVMKAMDDLRSAKLRMVTQGKEVIIEAGIFRMDDMEVLASFIPDEVLPPYRKKRTYINSVLSTNEVSRAGYPGCKLAFMRVERGVYIINPRLVFPME